VIQVKIACQESLLPGRDLLEKAENAKKFGFEGIELWGSGLKERVGEIKKVMDKVGIPVSTICAGYRGTPLDADRSQRELAIEDSKEILSVAADLGAVGMIFVPIFGHPRMPDLSPLYNPYELERELLLKLLDDLGAHAEKVGTYLLLEPLNRYETHFINRLEQAVWFCEKVGREGVKIMADFFHMSIEESDLAQAIRAAGPYIKHVHLADSNRLLPGWGHTDFKTPFAALKEIGYENFMAMECGVPGNPEESLPKSVNYLRQFI
jgi:sugar phosphate isomerase/epimerase